jgi:toxin ParE1/3/4
MRLELARFIESDLAAIGDYIAADNPRRALSFIQEIRDSSRRLANTP